MPNLEEEAMSYVMLYGINSDAILAYSIHFFLHYRCRKSGHYIDGSDLCRVPRLSYELSVKTLGEKLNIVQLAG